jgi:UDP-3-O-[3-hydroxymyristoyl] N-acetylglucosamine deacetylase
MFISSQKTIDSKISLSGVGVHSGKISNITLLPAEADAQINFIRTDLKKGENIIKANYKNVTAASLGTTISNEFGASVSTIEHLMAAIWGSGIDNLTIEIDNQEMPIMDGSSEPFIFLIECAGIKIQEKQRRFIEILSEVKVEDGDKFIEVKPSTDFSIDLGVDFNNQFITAKNYQFSSNISSFKNDLCKARTFGFENEINHLRSIGFAKGGSLKNAILVGENGIINEEGLRYNDEFVRHKTIDFIGDIYLAGYFISGAFRGFKTGHAINNKILHKIFSDEKNWRLI